MWQAGCSRYDACMRSPTRTISVIGLVCALVLTACFAEQEDDSATPEPTAISPDTLVTCEDNGDCGEAGSVRWSLPLEGEYTMYIYSDLPAVLVPQTQASVSDHFDPEAIVHDGVLYHYDHEQVLAVELADTEKLWTEEVDPDQLKSVQGLQAVGDQLVMTARENREWNSLAYLLDPTEDGLEWGPVDVEGEGLGKDTLPANHTHVLLTTSFGPGTEDVRTLMNAATGEVEWASTLPGWIGTGALSEDTLFTLERSGEDSDDPDLVHRIDLADGQVVNDFPVPEGMEVDRLIVSENGDLIVAGRAVMDPENTELLWRIGASDEFQGIVEGDPTLLHLSRGDDHWLVDARTGEEVYTSNPAFSPESFGAEEQGHEGGVDTSESGLLFRPLVAEGPEVRGFDIDLGAGTRHLVSYQDEEGAYVGVYQACAPDGVRELGWESPTDSPGCTAPRLFAVDYGVVGSVPQ